MAPVAVATGGSGLLLVFLITLCIPGTLAVGGLQLNLYKTFLLFTTIPLGVLWLRGRAGPIVATDLLMLGYATWQVLSLGIHHGIARVPYMGTNFVESFGAYLVGRVLVTGPGRFLAFFRYLLLCFAVLLPFAFVELLTGRRLWSDLFGKVLTMGGYERGEKRMGLTRVALGFPHPIHVGFLASLAVANVYYIFAGRWLRRLAFSGLAGVMVFVGLSSAPMLGVGLQGVMIAWDRIVRFLTGHWVLFGLIGFVSLAVLQMILPGGIIGYIVNEVIFNPYGGANRIDIFRYGIAEVWRNPVFGIGLNEWRRPYWQHSTLDNYWLLVTMRYGIPGFLLLASAIVVSALSIATAPRLDATAARYRTGYLIALASGIVVLCTVHIWDSPVAFFMAYLGAGAWFYAARETAAEDTSRERGASGPQARPRRAGMPAGALADVSGEMPGGVTAGNAAGDVAGGAPRASAGTAALAAAETRRRAGRRAALQRRTATAPGVAPGRRPEP